MPRINRAGCLTIALILITSFGAIPLAADVVRVEIESREDLLEGKPFGTIGAYEQIEGKMYFAFDPENQYNARIVDLDLAPRNEEGLVEAWADFSVLKPKDPAASSGVALVEVANRGGKAAMIYLNRGSRGTDEEKYYGDGLLMRMGVTVVWVGWQFDVPDARNVVRFNAPFARGTDGPITGLVRSDWVVDRATADLELSHRRHVAYPVLDPHDEENVLTVREGRLAPREVIPRSDWTFARFERGQVIDDPTHIHMSGGFPAGKIYELVYRAKDPKIAGLGLAAIRDAIAYVKYDESCEFPARYGIAFGVSQSGRFLRHFLYEGFNTDEQGRMAYDGMLIHAAGAGRGSFNHRFAQPSRDAHRYSSFFFPTDLFPFSGRAQTDPETGVTDGLLIHAFHEEHLPKIFYTNTGYEYWGRAAALTHVSPDGTQDIEPLPNERMYHIAGTQHFSGPFPPRPRLPRLGENMPVIRGNPVDILSSLRSLWAHLFLWVHDDIEPLPSQYPRIADGTLDPIEEVNFPAIPGVTYPTVAHEAYRVDYGPRWTEGIIDREPPEIGKPFPVLVPQVDGFGNETGGIAGLELRVPIATYFTWNLRSEFPAAKDELIDFQGTYVPLPRTDEEREAFGDPRPSVLSLHESRDAYYEKIVAAINEMVNQRLLLSDDASLAVEQAMKHWDWLMGGVGD